MGCDIHLYVERRTHAGWEHVPDSSDVYDDPRRWFHQRNYNLFSILADVRNGYGFAGAKTGEGFQSISPPRGLPINASVEVQAESERWGVDGHSHSHLTLAEVLSFDWDQETTLTGLFEDKDARFPEGGRADWIQRFADDYKELPTSASSYWAEVYRAPEGKYKRVTWTQPYYRCVSGDWWATVARASRLTGGNLHAVRFVFWFDN